MLSVFMSMTKAHLRIRLHPTAPKRNALADESSTYKVRGARKGNTGFGGFFTSKIQGAGENEKGGPLTGSTERPY